MRWRASCHSFFVHGATHVSYREKPAVAHVLDAPSLRKALAREASKTFTASIRRAGSGASFADLLSRVYSVADELVTMLETGQDPSAIQKRADSIKSIAKTLPLLQQAERNALTQIKHKALEDLTDAELVKLVSDAQDTVTQAGKPRFPHAASKLIGSTSTRRKNKKSISDSVSDVPLADEPASAMSGTPGLPCPPDSAHTDPQEPLEHGTRGASPDGTVGTEPMSYSHGTPGPSGPTCLEPAHDAVRQRGRNV
jgi:hypothetical protein